MAELRAARSGAGSGLPTNPFARLDRLLQNVVVQQKDRALIASVGDPQAKCPVPSGVISDNAHLWGRYPPLRGTAELRKAIGGWLDRRFHLGQDWLAKNLDFLPAAGTREAIFLATKLCVSRRTEAQGRAVVVPSPCYPGYVGSAIASGGQLLPLPVKPGGRFLPDLEEMASLDLSRVAMIFLTNPSNPQGTAASAGYLKQLLELTTRHGVVLAVDECCIDLYLERPPTGVLEVCRRNGLSTENLIVFNSLSKRSYAAGLRSGFVAGCPAMISQMNILRSYVGATVPLPIQAASAVLWDDDVHGEAIRRELRLRFDLAEEILGNQFEYYRPDAGFFLWLRVDDDEGVAEALWRQGVKVMPGRYLAQEGADGFNAGSGYIRIALVHELEDVGHLLRQVRRVAG